MAERTEAAATHRSVVVYLAENCAELLSLGIAAWLTGSVALRAQTAANSAEIAVELFLLIGLLLLGASVLLLRTNRALLSGRGLPLAMLREMSRIVAAQPGVVDVPDLFGVVIGPSIVIVNGDVTFVDALDVPAVEQAIVRSAAALRARWPSIEYVYLTPVSKARSRRYVRSKPRTDGDKLPGQSYAEAGGTPGAVRAVFGSVSEADPAAGTTGRSSLGECDHRIPGTGAAAGTSGVGLRPAPAVALHPLEPVDGEWRDSGRGRELVPVSRNVAGS